LGVNFGSIIQRAIADPIRAMVDKYPVIDFHVNIALSTITMAKGTHYLNREKQERGPFSMADIKTEHYNMFLLDLFLLNLEISPKSKKNQILEEDQASHKPGHKGIVDRGVQAAGVDLGEMLGRAGQ